MQWTDPPWGLWLILRWYRLHPVLSLKAMLAKTTVDSPCEGRCCSGGGVPAPCWLWTVLGWMLSCLMGVYRCLKFLPGHFWYPVKDTWWMRDQALKLQIVAWSTEHIDSSCLLGLWLSPFTGKVGHLLLSTSKSECTVCVCFTTYFN